MSLVIRMQRRGTKKKATYRIVVVEKHMPRDGKCVEIIGYENRDAGEKKVFIERDRALHWLGKGAKPSLRVRHILHDRGIIQEYEDARPPKKPRRRRRAPRASSEA